MPVPSVVQLVVNNQPLFFVLKSISKDEVTYYDDNKKLFKANSKEFKEQWTGVCLLVEITESTKEKDIDAKINAMRFKKLVGVSLAIMLLTWIGLLFSNAEISLSSLSLSVIVGYSLFKVFGITVGVFLLWFDIDQYNPTLQNFCTGGSERINCNASSQEVYMRDDTLNFTLQVSSNNDSRKITFQIHRKFHRYTEE